jgi:hypothetical protein
MPLFLGQLLAPSSPAGPIAAFALTMVARDAFAAAAIAATVLGALDLTESSSWIGIGIVGWYGPACACSSGSCRVRYLTQYFRFGSQ